MKTPQIPDLKEIHQAYVDALEFVRPLLISAMRYERKTGNEPGIQDLVGAYGIDAVKAARTLVVNMQFQPVLDKAE